MRRRVLRWLKRFALTLLALMVASIGVALIALHTDWGRERVRRIAEGALASTFPGGVRIGRIEGSVLGELVARDVELRAADGSLFARVGALRIELALRPLLGKTARVDRLIADDVELYPMRTIAPPDPEPTAWSVALPAIEVHRARLVIEAGMQTVTLDGLDLTGEVAVPAGAPIAASARLRGTWRERGVLVEGSVAATVGEIVALSRLDARVGGVSVRGTDIAVDPARPVGVLQIDAPASAVRRLVPGVELPADARLDVTAVRAAGGEIAIELTGSLGAARLTGTVRADLAGARVRGVISARGVALAEATRGAHTGEGSAIVAFVADRARMRGTVIATGRVDELPAGDAVVGFDAALEPARGGLDALAGAAGLVLAAGDGGTTARGFARLERRGGVLAIDAGRIDAATRDVALLAGARAPIRGRVAIGAELDGTAAPLDVMVRGTLDGDGLEYGEDRTDSLSARRLHAGFLAVAKGSLARAVGEATGWIRGVADAGVPRGDARFGAKLRGDRTIAAWIKARPAAAPAITLDATAIITPGGPGGTTLVALGDHAIAMPGGARWTGRGGRVVIGPALVTLDHLRTTNRGGRVDVGATFHRETKRLTVALDANAVAAAALGDLAPPAAGAAGAGEPAYRGTLSGAIRLERRGLRWDGTIAADARGLAFAPDAAPLDADLRATVAGRRVAIETTARTAALGGVRFDLDVDGPPDLTDPGGWLSLPRAAVRSARLGVDRVDLTAAAVPTGGVVDGALTIAGADTTGTMTVRGVHTPLGDVEGDITFRAEDRGELGATSTVHVSGLGDADVSARIAFPAHPFDPEAWQRLGRGALARLGASFSDIAIDPERLAALGIAAPYRGVADIDLVIAGGAAAATVDVDVKDISGGPIARPIDLHVSATVDASAGTRVRGHVRDTREPERTLLASFEGAVPSFTVDRWIAAPGQARYAPITGGLVTIPGLQGPGGQRPAVPLRAPVLLAVFGRDDLAAGTILGTVSIGGTLGTPTAEAHLALSGLQSSRRVPGKPAPKPTDLTIDARWGGASGRIAIAGRSGGGTIVATAEGAPAELGKVFGSVTATDFDVAPLAAFLPGELTAIEGQLAANLTVRGLDSLGKLRGSLAIARAVVPLHPMLGTLRDGTARAKIDDRGVELDLAGALGRGRLLLTARSAGHELAQIAATAKLDGVSPLGEWEPVIAADLDAQLRRTGTEQWTGAIKISNASAVLPPSAAELGDPDKPRDLLFVEDGPIVRPKFALGGRPPERPWLAADVELAPMKVKAEDLFDSRGEISGRLELEVGDTVGLRGNIDIETGIVGDLFGRRYGATGFVRFDGTLEPTVAIALQHKFPAFSLLVGLAGTPTAVKPEFSSDPPGLYTPDQLAGFFLGGEPGGDPSAQTREAATGAGAAVLSSALGARIKKRLPIKIEQLGCDPGNSVTAASCTVGRWFGEKLFVAFKRRIDAQQYENANANEVQGQYYLRRDLYFEMAGGDAGSGGLDLLWRRRW